MSADEYERLWRRLRDIQDTQTQHAAELRGIRTDLLEYRAAQAEVHQRHAEASRQLAIRTGAVGAVGAGSVAALFPLLQTAGHLAGLW